MRERTRLDIPPDDSSAYAPVMRRGDGAGDIARALAKAEAAPPVDAVEGVTRELGLALGATKCPS